MIDNFSSTKKYGKKIITRRNIKKDEEKEKELNKDEETKIHQTKTLFS